jgi:TetR/AcrR family transcriptional regulator, cholesterol catabolism regulator
MEMDERTRQILIESGKLLLKYGLRNLSMDDISRELGISKKTLYQVCENKSDLIDKILQFHQDASMELINNELNSGKNAIEMMLYLSTYACDNMKDFTASHTFELQKYYPEAFKKFNERKRLDTFQWIRLNLEKGIEEGLYRHDIDKDLIAMIHIQNLEDMFDHEFLSTLEIPFSRVFEARYESHIRSIATPKGLKYFEKRKSEMNKS